MLVFLKARTSLKLKSMHPLLAQGTKANLLYLIGTLSVNLTLFCSFLLWLWLANTCQFDIANDYYNFLSFVIISGLKIKTCKLPWFRKLQFRGSSYPIASICELAPECTDGWSYVPLICTSTLHLFTVSLTCTLYTERMTFTYFELLFNSFFQGMSKKSPVLTCSLPLSQW